MTIGKVKRETTAEVRASGKRRRVIVTIYRDGTLGLRAKGTRAEYFADIAQLYRRLELADAENENHVDAGPCRNPRKRIGV